MEAVWLIILIPALIAKLLFYIVPLSIMALGLFIVLNGRSLWVCLSGGLLGLLPFMIYFGINMFVWHEARQRVAMIDSMPRAAGPHKLPKTLVVRDDWELGERAYLTIMGTYKIDRIVVVSKFVATNGLQRATVLRRSGVFQCADLEGYYVRTAAPYFDTEYAGERQPFRGQAGHVSKCLSRTEHKDARVVLPRSGVELRTGQATSFKEFNQRGLKFELASYDGSKHATIDAYEFRHTYQPQSPFCLPLTSSCWTEVRAKGEPLSIYTFFARSFPPPKEEEPSAPIIIRRVVR